MIDFPVLSLITFLPLLGTLFILCVNGDEAVVARNARNTALVTSLFTLGLSIYMYTAFDTTSADFQFVEKCTWFPGINIAYKMGIDGISVFFILLSALLTPLCILSSWHAVEKRVKEYMIAFLLLETMMIGTFWLLTTTLRFLIATLAS